MCVGRVHPSFFLKTGQSSGKRSDVLSFPPSLLMQSAGIVRSRPTPPLGADPAAGVEIPNPASEQGERHERSRPRVGIPHGAGATCALRPGDFTLTAGKLRFSPALPLPGCGVAGI